MKNENQMKNKESFKTKKIQMINHNYINDRPKFSIIEELVFIINT
jgi:hypothetical protein